MLFLLIMQRFLSRKRYMLKYHFRHVNASIPLIWAMPDKHDGRGPRLILIENTRFLSGKRRLI